MNDTDTVQNIIGFHSFIDENGNRIYGCRGIGIGYDYFFNTFIVGLSYKMVETDFPWTYFVFTDIHDEQDFLRTYSKIIDYVI